MITDLFARLIPLAALFFCAYETSKKTLKTYMPERYDPIVHMVSASAGEVTACLIRVPVEVVKQRAQATHSTSSLILKTTLSREGFAGLYRGYLSTIVREIPFSLIVKGHTLHDFFLTISCQTPRRRPPNRRDNWCGLDLAKTRIMLAEKGKAFSFTDILVVLKVIYQRNGFTGLFSGAVPRVTQISIGGAIFLGGYDIISNFLKAL
ncbi:unnamed protein product [Oppiella nova]|uniref:Mitochondrial carrier protein n=1 Tax=Oppiella nova TaxID=334625 RepID=A0A7R9LD40_9ACAR|nr:unnamed protein product [Oppiella nova]CAG2162244.1 unnamed protein product [Oppiella nova]